MAHWALAQRRGPTGKSIDIDQICQRRPLPGRRRGEKQKQDDHADPDAPVLIFTLIISTNGHSQIQV
jgi:hypothetical protein